MSHIEPGTVLRVNNDYNAGGAVDLMWSKKVSTQTLQLGLSSLLGKTQGSALINTDALAG